MSGQLTGRAFISLNGARITSMEGAKLKFGGVKRDIVTADTGVAGFRESVVAPEVECKIPHSATVNLQDLADFKDGSVMFETDSGRVFSLSDAWTQEPPEMEKGEVSIKFAAITCVES